MIAPSRPAPATHRLVMVLDDLGSGGGSRVMLRLASAFAQAGCAVHLAVGADTGVARHDVPAGVDVTVLAPAAHVGLLRARVVAGDPWPRLGLLRGRVADGALRQVPALTALLRGWRPDAVLGAGLFTNLLAVWAVRAARSPARVVVSEHISLRGWFADHLARRQGRAQRARAQRRVRELPRVVASTYRRAAAVVAVSNGVAQELSTLLGPTRDAVRVVGNPVLAPSLAQRAAQAPDHPWFAPGQAPPLLAIGRLAPQKDYPTLLRALARLTHWPDLRLVILGEGGEGPALHALARELGLGARVSLPGYAANPFAYLARARALVMSSRFEGLPLVLIEALACGCPVVSTDCPHGPAEILDGGRYGALVPVGDPARLADAIARTLAQAPDPTPGRARAQAYTVEASARAYGELLWPDRNPFGV